MNYPTLRNLYRAVVIGLLAIGFSISAFAEEPPAKMLVGVPAGGPFDIVARILAEKLQPELDRQVLVENKPGAGTRLAVDALKIAPADGSVMMLGPDALMAIYPYTLRKLNYDPKKDLVPVITVAEFAFAMSSGADPKVENLAAYVAWARKHPEQANVGVPALGAPQHFFGLMLGEAIGIRLNVIPFQGGAPLTQALMGGHVSAGFDGMISMVENHRSGKIRVLAVATDKRVPQLPDVPTFAEAGFPGVTGMGFCGIYAPAGTPVATIAKWNTALAKVLALPEVKDKLFAMGFFIVGKSPDELAARTAVAAKFWEPVIRKSGFVAD